MTAMDGIKKPNPALVASRPANAGLVPRQSGPPPEPKEPQSELPEKFQGKSPEEIVKMYSELESQLGRQGQELGQLRAMVQQRQAEPKERTDILDDPERAVSEIVNERIAPMMAQTFEATLDKRFPDWREEVQSTEFSDWALRSKTRRMALAAAQNYDVESAVDLMESWMERKGAKEGAATEAEQAVDRDRKLRAQVTETGSATTRTKGKIYSRRWVQDLMRNDPQRYRLEQADIARAYKEGRYTD